MNAAVPPVETPVTLDIQKTAMTYKAIMSRVRQVTRQCAWNVIFRI